MPTPKFRCNDNNNVVNEEEAKESNLEYFFNYDGKYIIKESSGRKKIFRGEYQDKKSGQKTRALLIEFQEEASNNSEDDCSRCTFGEECSSLGKANVLGVGPKILKTINILRDNTIIPAIIEEDVGVSLADAMKSSNQKVIPCTNNEKISFNDIGIRGRKKIIFDIIYQVKRLHDNNLYHRDIRIENVCIYKFGKEETDIRATLIDFELIDKSSSRDLSYLCKEYFNPIFQCDIDENRSLLEQVSPIELDLGFLAAFCFEVEKKTFIYESNNSEIFHDPTQFSCRFFSRINGYCQIERLSTEEDLEPLAKEIDLRNITDLPSKDRHDNELINLARKLFHNKPFLDSRELEELNNNPDAILLKEREKFARRRHEEIRKPRLIEQGRGSEAVEFYEQNIEDIESALAHAKDDMEKLKSLGYTFELVADDEEESDKYRIKELQPEEIDKLSIMEQGRWYREKIKNGWQYGERNNKDKKHDGLFSEKEWDKVPEKYKELTRDPYKQIVGLLKQFGIIIRR